MKELYSKPIADIQEFKNSTIITTSGNPADDNDVVWGT